MGVKATIITQDMIMTGVDLYNIHLLHTADDPMSWNLYAFLENGDRILIRSFNDYQSADQAYTKIADAFADEGLRPSEWIIDYRTL